MSIWPNGCFAGKHVLVTGGTSGIDIDVTTGTAIALDLTGINGAGDYISDVGDNVHPRLKFWDEVEEFPAIHLNAGNDILQNFSDYGSAEPKDDTSDKYGLY